MSSVQGYLLRNYEILHCRSIVQESSPGCDIDGKPGGRCEFWEADTADVSYREGKLPRK